MIEFLVTILLCSNPFAGEGCQAVGQRFVSYTSIENCVEGELEVIASGANNLLEQGEIDLETYEALFSSTLVVCQQSSQASKPSI